MPAIVRVTENFERNLTAIRAFLIEADAPRAFDALIDRLLHTVIPNLEHFPELGRPFFVRAACSVAARHAAHALRKRLDVLTGDAGDGALRELVFDDYLILYFHRSATVDLLSVRHHRQISFDFPAE
jgi:plasmid stabilization system protein ParE